MEKCICDYEVMDPKGMRIIMDNGRDLGFVRFRHADAFR